MKPQQIAVLVVAATIGLMLFLLFVYGRPRRTEQEPLPANFHRGDPDNVLETSRLAKIQTWGFASALFIAGFMSIYFVQEPFREAHWERKFLRESVERGEFEFGVESANCASCHGPKGEGAFAFTDPAWPAPPLNNEFHRYTRQDIRRIIEMGRPGTPMPAWGVAFGGPLNDQRIDDILNYLESIQVPAEEKYELPAGLADGRAIYAQKCAVCHGPDARGQALGRPLPTFYAADLTTEFHRLGVKVLQERIMVKDPALDAARARQLALARPLPEIMAAGEEAAKSTVEKGRANTPMPAWKNRITDDQIAAVVAYLRSIQRVPS